MAQDSKKKVAVKANGNHTTLVASEAVELAEGESINLWAERFASTMEKREAEQEEKRPRWNPLRIIGLSVR